MGKRFAKEDENMTEVPEQEEAIFFGLGDKSAAIPAGKTVIEYTLPELSIFNEKSGDEEKILSRNIFLGQGERRKSALSVKMVSEKRL